jgi:DSF synthase
MRILSIEDIRHIRLPQAQLRFDPEYDVIWFYFLPSPRPCFNMTLLDSIAKFHDYLIENEGAINYKGELYHVKYQVLASGIPGVFNYGGDLNLFIELINNKDKDGLLKYAHACIKVLYRSAVNFDLPITTIALVQGSALGGGFEAALANNLIIAEEDSQFGLPEIIFNLFPGMGAYSLLSRKISIADTEKLILGGHMHTAQDLKTLGVVDIIAPKNGGEEAVLDYIKNNRKHFNGKNAVLSKVKKLISPLTYKELSDICDIWVDTALQLNERDLRVIQRLVNAQNKQIDELDTQQRQMSK